MTNLTEKWKNKELEWHKSYYCRNKKDDICIATLMDDDTLDSQELGGTLNFEYWEVLAPVPSYQEYLESESHCAVYSEVNKWLKDENQQLKELLRECRETIETSVWGNCSALTDQIDEVIGEK